MFSRLLRPLNWLKFILTGVFQLPIEPRALILRLYFIHLYANIYAYLRRRREFSDIVEIFPGTTSSVRRIAIIVCHKPTPDIRFLISALRNESYHIVAYTYSSDDIENYFCKDDTVFLRKEVFGRDFYAYKHASLNVIPKLIGVEQVLYVNDSCFFSPEIDKVIQWFANNLDYPWAAFSVNLRKHFHAGSFLFQISGLASSHVEDFFRQYFPRNTRYHTIHFGESALSHFLVNKGFTPKCWIWESRCVDTFISIIENETSISGAKQNLASSIADLFRYNEFDHSDIISNTNRFRTEIIRFAEDDNLLNRIGLYLYDYGVIPILKKDAIYRNKSLNFLRYQVRRPEISSSAYKTILFARERQMKSFPNTFTGRMRKLIALIDD